MEGNGKVNPRCRPRWERSPLAGSARGLCFPLSGTLAKLLQVPMRGAFSRRPVALLKGLRS